MLKIVFFTCLIFILAGPIKAQNKPDSLINKLSNTTADAERMKIYFDLKKYYYEHKADSLLYYSQQALLLAQKLNDKKAEVDAWEGIAYALYNTGNYSEAVEIALKIIDLATAIRYDNQLGIANLILAHIARNGEDYKKSLSYYMEALSIGKKVNDESLQMIAYIDASYLFVITGELDSGIYYNEIALNLCNKLNNKFHLNEILETNALIYEKQGKDELARHAYLQSIESAFSTNNFKNLAWTYNDFSKFYKRLGKIDSCIYYARISLDLSTSLSFPYNMLHSADILTSTFKGIRQFDSVFKYQQLSLDIRDSLFSQDKTRRIQWLSFNRQLETQKISAEKMQYVNRIRTYLLLGGLLVLFLIVGILYRNNRFKQRTNALLEERNRKIEDTLKQLLATQKQLIQSEKMASLGELTAGIAHEIQNPLNFVNNFSEVNKELVDELEQEAGKGNLEEVKAIAKDIKDNEEKINHHGKRADAIVKGMLQHSRSSSGQKEPTDINALTDEYLRLAYHGLRAKDKSFNTQVKTDFDNSIGRINIIPQDIGRVVLNLINNAFYAVTEKKRQIGEARLNDAVGQGYEPNVSVTTKKVNDKVEVRVKDNGSGIAQRVVDKIFQPFFTTKPTGQGTGLGLSLSYDIIKAHGGELKVETKEGEGATFIIHLPLRQ